MQQEWKTFSNTSLIGFGYMGISFYGDGDAYDVLLFYYMGSANRMCNDWIDMSKMVIRVFSWLIYSPIFLVSFHVWWTATAFGQAPAKNIRWLHTVSAIVLGRNFDIKSCNTKF
jgi:hypothetical protein